MESTGFHQLMQDLSGRARMESEDPKWGALLSSVEFYSDKYDASVQMSHYCSRLVKNSGKSNNLLMLLEQTVSRLGQIIKYKHGPSKSVAFQCCASLHLSNIVFCYLFSHLEKEQVAILK